MNTFTNTLLAAAVSLSAVTATAQSTADAGTQMNAADIEAETANNAASGESIIIPLLIAVLILLAASSVSGGAAPQIVN